MGRPTPQPSAFVRIPWTRRLRICVADRAHTEVESWGKREGFEYRQACGKTIATPTNKSMKTHVPSILLRLLFAEVGTLISKNDVGPDRPRE